MFHNRGSGQISLLKYSGIIMNSVDTNIFFTTGIIAAVLFVALFVFLLITVSKERQRVQDELSGKEGVYVGPAGEPQWSGKLPEKVDDYTKPRYVYENLVETTICQPENGRIIGYRISPSLVIHSRTQNVKPSSVVLYRDRFGGKLLDFSEVKTLVPVWKEISELRVAAGDKPLEGKFLYATDRGSVVICNMNSMTWEYPDATSLEGHLLVLKR